MAKTKDQLRTENNANFPNNNSQFITPEKIRDYNTDVIDSVALEVNPQLSGEGTFGSLSGSGAVSASTYYGDGSNLTGVIKTVPAGTVSGSSQIILDDTTGDLSGSRITGSVDTSISASFATTASFALNVTPIDTGSFARTDIANNFTGSNNTFPMQFDLRPTNSAPNDDSRFRFDSFQNRMQISLVSDDTFFDREIRFYPSASYSGGFPQDSELGLKIAQDGVFGYGNRLVLTDTSLDDLAGFIISGSDDGDSYVIKLSDTKIMEYNYDSDFIILENINARGGITVQSSFNAPLTEGYGWFGNSGGVSEAQSTSSFAKTDVANDFTGSNNTFPLQFDLRPTNSPASGDPRFRFDSFQNRMQISLVAEDTFFDREIRFYPSASYASGFPQDSEIGASITENGLFSFGNQLNITDSSNDILAGFEVSSSDEGTSYVTYLSNEKVMEYNQDSDFIIHNNINAPNGFTSTADSIVKSLSTTAFIVSSGDSDTSPIVMEGGFNPFGKFDASRIRGVDYLDTLFISSSGGNWHLGGIQIGSPSATGFTNYGTGAGSRTAIRLAADGGEGVYDPFYADSAGGGGVESQLRLKGTEVTISSSTGSKQTSVDIDGDVTASNLNISEVINLTEVDPLPTGNVGDLAVSSSQLYFYNGAWTQIS